MGTTRSLKRKRKFFFGVFMHRCSSIVYKDSYKRECHYIILLTLNSYLSRFVPRHFWCSIITIEALYPAFEQPPGQKHVFAFL